LEIFVTKLFFDVEGDDLKSENPKKAIEMFEKVVELETNLGDQVKWFCVCLINIVLFYSLIV
jgi:hypothetical protein